MGIANILQVIARYWMEARQYKVNKDSRVFTTGLRYLLISSTAFYKY